jgi:predicted phage baseplate assembly protein
MPLETLLPAIDDRRFDDIVAEARTRIARYAPEWTDVNDNDPGMALVQVFAWLTEMLIYRLGKVPELNYLKFLELLGIELNAAEPAQTEITFPVLETFPETVVIVPRLTQVSAEAPDGGAPVIFETERSLFALKAHLTAVQSFDGYLFTDVSSANTEAEAGYEPFGPLASPESALFLGFSLNEPFPQVELNLAVYIFEAGSRAEDTSRLTQCGLEQTQVFPSAQIAWETWNGSAWQSLGVLKDETHALTNSGHIHLKLPAKGVMKQTTVGEVTAPLYWIRGRLAESAYERPPRLLMIRTNTVAAQQAETARDEVLGGSDGSPNQTFQLANAPVLRETLKLEVNEGDGFRAWTRVNDFFGSSGQDEHYLLDRTSGRIRFGDGTNGRIPVANVQDPASNVVAREYRFGGGRRGNVPAGSLKTLLTTVAGVDENGVTNLQAATSGREEETLAQAQLRAPQSLKNKCRAVTEEDFAALARQAADIRRAKALSLFHPGFPGVKVPGVVTVIVVPDSEAPNPTPSEGTRRTVCAYLNQRRLLTTEVFVIAPTYRLVEVRVEATAAGNADLADLSQGIEKALLDYFHPLTGGEDGGGWPFGATILYSRVYQRVFTVPGVQSIERLVITLDGEEAAECANVPIGEGALLYSTQHEVEVNYEFSS